MKKEQRKFSSMMVAAIAALVLTASSGIAADFDACHQQCKDLYLTKIDTLLAQPTSSEVRTQVLGNIDELNRCVADCGQGISPLPAEPAPEPAPAPVSEPASTTTRGGKRK